MYKPKKSTESKIPLIEKMYYDDNLSITKISKLLKMDFHTVHNVLTYCLHGVLSKSEASKRTFKNLSEEQKKAFITASTEKRRSDKEYIRKLSDTKLWTKNPSSVLNEEKVREILKKYDELLKNGYRKTEEQIALGEQYGVKRPTISDVVLRKTWKHID